MNCSNVGSSIKLRNSILAYNRGREKRRSHNLFFNSFVVFFKDMELLLQVDMEM